jgi:hypothetical protein
VVVLVSHQSHCPPPPPFSSLIAEAASGTPRRAVMFHTTHVVTTHLFLSPILRIERLVLGRWAAALADSDMNRLVERLQVNYLGFEVLF